MRFSRIASSVFLIVMLFSASVSASVYAQTEEPSGQSYQDINVNIVYSMVTNGSFLNLIVLDVRFQCEYDMEHLYGAIMMPYDQLEMRIGELDEHRNHEIVVYCRSGYRSQMASEILVAYNFTKVYNMLGGILAWAEAGYPIWTTSHYVTVNVIDEEIQLQTEPLLLHQTGCLPCTLNQTCPNGGKPANITFTVLEQEENYTGILAAYEVNGTTFNVTVAKTLLQSYEEHTAEANRTLDFAFTEVSTQNSLIQFYGLSYLVHHFEYNLTLYTRLSPLNPETYNNSFTVINYAPAEPSECTSFEFVDVNSTVTLSQLYTILGKVVKEVGKVYEKSGDESLSVLAQAYYTMKEEAKRLSKIVENQLPQYNLEILRSSAVLMDGPTGPPLLNGGGSPPPSTCTLECFAYYFIDCFIGDISQLSMACLWGCALGSLICGPFYPSCL